MVFVGAVREPPRTPITHFFVEAHGTRGASPDNVGSRGHQSQWRAPSSRTLRLRHQKKRTQPELVAATWTCDQSARNDVKVIAMFI